MLTTYFAHATALTEHAFCQVPLDYSDPQGPQAVVALVKNPARGPGKARGPVLVNPGTFPSFPASYLWPDPRELVGGPGGSGTEFAIRYGAVLQQYVVGDDFDIIGFDPRCVSARVHCAKT